MKMTLEQTRLVGLTLELDCKAREYQALCKQYEVLKSEILDENDKRWVELQQKLVSILNNQIDSDLLEKEKVRQLRIERKLANSRKKVGK